jgi:hypothetical protein
VNGGGKARVILDPTQQNPFDSPLYICIPPTGFAGGNGSGATLYDFARTLATCGTSCTVGNPGRSYNGKIIPTGGTFTLNGNSCGNYEFNILPGGTTLSQTTVATLFSSTQDSVSSWIVCRGNLTIADNTYLIPTNNTSYTTPSTATYQNPSDPNALRKLFMVVYVTGNLIFGGSAGGISMSGCGANTDTTGANITSVAIPIATGVKNGGSSYNPVIQATGAAGGAAYSSGGGGNNGSSASASVSSLSTGGGSSGRQATGGTSGAGGAGSCFSGGAGGGGMAAGGTASAGSSRGGAGGSTPDGAGGSGNPGGTGTDVSSNYGTGGILIIICEGSISGNSKIYANGVSGYGATAAGGSSGGGVAVVIQSASGGSYSAFYAYGGNGIYGVNGGNGSAVTYGINS